VQMDLRLFITGMITPGVGEGMGKRGG